EVPLEKEIKFIKNYSDIEKMRYGDKVDIDIRATGNLKDRKIAPLVLLPFVENCFKHGASEDLQQSWVKVSIDAQPHGILTKVENNKVVIIAIQKKTCIGIENERRRLDMIFPDYHELKIING